MKIFKKILIALVILVVVGIIGVFVFLKTFDIDRFKPQIIAGASAALGRTVDFEDIDLRVSLKEGVHLTLKQLTISDDPAFQNEDFLTVENISLGVGIIPLLKKRQILISHIHVDSPHIVVIRKKDGLTNVQSLFLKKDPVPVPITAPRALFIFAETIVMENGEVTYIDQSFKPEFALDVSQIQLKIDRFSLNESFPFTLEAAYLSAQPNLFIKGELELGDYAGAQNFNFNVNIHNMDLSEILNQKEQPVRLKGLLAGEFRAQGQGFTPDTLRRSLSGEGTLEIKEGRLTDINVLKVVLNKISTLPNLAAKVEAVLPPRHKEKLTQKHTILTKVKTDMAVKNGLVSLKPIEIEADSFLFFGAGEIDFNQRFFLDGSFFIPADLSTSMVASVSELQYLLDEKGKIYIPLKVSGEAQNIKFAVDLEYIMGKLIIGEVSEELKKVIDKLFD
jgi:uncharacterized protein involved in outer membrane biogenesis